MGLDLRRYGWYQQCGLTFIAPENPWNVRLAVSFSGWFGAPIGYVWLLLWPSADPICSCCVGLLFCCHILIIAILNKRVQFFVTKVVLKISMIKARYWIDMTHINYIASEITRFNHQLANLNNALVHMLIVAMCDKVRIWNSISKIFITRATRLRNFRSDNLLPCLWLTEVKRGRLH